MKFSVVIPLYNKEDFIERTVSSVLRQTEGDFELIVVDDGSTDGSVGRLAGFTDPRLHLIRQPNAGEGPARNTGMRASRGEWIALLDADDYWFPDHLAELARMAEQHRDAGLLATSFLEGEEGDAEPPASGDARIREIAYFAEAARDIGIVWSSTVALRRSVAERVGGFEAYRTGADLEYWARVALVAPVVKSTRVTAYYFRNDQSVMAQAFRERSSKPVPATLFDLWPSVAFLERIKTDQEPAVQADIIRYQRNAVFLTIASYVARGEVANARRVARLLPGRAIDRGWLLASALLIPAPLIRLGLRAKHILRQRLRPTASVAQP